MHPKGHQYLGIWCSNREPKHTMSKRVLVTTSDERTWPKDKPVLFLGEWCTRYSRRHVWESLDYKIMPCHWDDRREVHKTHALLIKLVDELVVELSSKLNGLHGTDYSVRYWNILLGCLLYTSPSPRD